MEKKKAIALQKAGGVAALAHSAAYVVGITLALSVVAPMLSAGPAEYLAKLEGMKTLMSLWIFVCYLLAAIALVVCTLALYDRMKNEASILIQLSSAFGLIWAGLIIGSGNLMIYDFGVLADLHRTNPQSALAIWPALKAVEDGLVSGNEMVGSLWLILLSIGGLTSGKLPKALNYLGIAVAVGGLATLIPWFMEVTGNMIFALGTIVWFIWLGVVLLRKEAH